ncbi:hypothetical protein HanPI659440_Chr16g0650781 [Helianthus annuus]|nr:hypothetical protein HanPI659440_Chr16g0650781 [Helianthus annuus]
MYLRHWIFDFGEELTCLCILRSKLSGSKTLRDKIYVVDSDLKVKRWLFGGLGVHSGGWMALVGWSDGGFVTGSRGVGQIWGDGVGGGG